MTNVNGRSGKKGRKTAGGLLGIVLLVIYWFVQPVLNEKLGFNLPSLRSGGSPATVQSEANSNSDYSTSKTKKTPTETAAQSEKVTQLETASSAPVSSGPAAGADATAKTDSSTDGFSDSSVELRYGLLREVQPDRFLSPAGLMYGPGSQEGHRLKHLERHVRDDPSRPGPHGVFDGGMEKALQVIDNAFEKAKQGQSGVSKQESDGRTVYTITMGSRIGFVGGRDGNRRNQPMARRLRLVLEGNRVITAFPL